MIINCLNCNKEFKDRPNRILSGRTKYCSKLCMNIIQKKYPIYLREKAYQWRGQKATYAAKHAWLYKHLEKPKKCSFCGIENIFAKDGRNLIEWANISGSYLRDINDYTQLCVICHRNYDNIRNGRIRYGTR